ncbi:LOW QUALITY PROTEIN: 3-galactosyl-N-acetylglucosaminide 4-alpha-L-fucosyltransferase FUT3-like [Sceloporus undulatus]|uniref:LOW QUALITY PROTEIN: 3-galactosyl-N-acetylglucosaminide 4-alpha-L-fucosyltransferase FUT3-like n=1 Tax=Sceloporus undulatus TaxID=8520 RepID=UPI001C4B2DC8|nr:LOW QUALITY PROTEIN: 3-galactosyl-N-acetylglucosaminide 4-alpha-L-fucosyltransferase FUT3-like [Sceloporus undulatus]
MDSKGQQPLNLTCRKVVTLALFQLGLSAIFFTCVRMSGKPDPGTPVPGTLHPPKQPVNSLPIERRSSNLTILLWTWPFGIPFAIERCSQVLGIPDCYITANRSWYRKADAVIVHHRDVSSSPKRLPQEPRPASQRWVWFNLESPSASPNLGFMDNHFNLTMSYRRDSDIFSPYGTMEVLPRPQNVTVPPKSKLVAWVVSNWDLHSHRVKYYEELKKYLQVDVYGRHHSPLPDSKRFSTLSQYKFYLAFENAIHEDYITEKVWRNAFRSWAVPVVLGPPRENYENYMPPDSFIHIHDFPSAKELAKFLHELDRNTTRYQSYFHWRSWLKPVGQFTYAQHFCKACRDLQKKPLQYQTVPALSKWFK